MSKSKLFCNNPEYFAKKTKVKLGIQFLNEHAVRTVVPSIYEYQSCVTTMKVA